MSTPLKKKVEFIAQNLYRHCVEPSGDRLSRTGRVSPKSNLRFSEGQQAFEWCWQVHERRYFTKGAVLGALKYLLDNYPVELPVSEAEWLPGQVKHVHHLCKRAVKNSSAWNNWENSSARKRTLSRSSSSLAMADWDETQAWDLEARSCASQTHFLVP